MTDRGRILVANRAGTYVLRFEGDVRLTLCVAIDDFLKQMFGDAGIDAVVVDLTNATGLDSTALGILAKLAKETLARTGTRPLLVCDKQDLFRSLVSLGIDELYEPTTAAKANGSLAKDEQLTVINNDEADEDATRSRVLEAHRVLMSLNPGNRETFKDLVTRLEALDNSGPTAGIAR